MGAGCSSHFEVLLHSEPSSYRRHQSNTTSTTLNTNGNGMVGSQRGGVENVYHQNDNSLANSARFQFGKKQSRENSVSSEIETLDLRAKKVSSFRIPGLRVSWIGFPQTPQGKSQEEVNLELCCSYLPQHLLFCLRYIYYGGEGKQYKKKLATPLPQSFSHNDGSCLVDNESKWSAFVSVNTDYSSHYQDSHAHNNGKIASIFKRRLSTSTTNTMRTNRSGGNRNNKTKAAKPVVSAAQQEEDRIKQVLPLSEFGNETCILVIEMKGFSKVVDSFYDCSTNCDVAEISRYIYYMYTTLIAIIHDMGGDIEKFEADLLVCQFFSPRVDRSFTDSILSAIQCAFRIQSLANLKTYKCISESAPLEIKCLIGVGDSLSYHLGGFGNHWMRMFGGQVVYQTRKRLKDCKEGLVFITKDAYNKCKQSLVASEEPGNLFLVTHVTKDIDHHPLASITFHCSFSQAILLFLNKNLLYGIETKTIESMNSVVELVVCTHSIKASLFGSSIPEHDLTVKNKIVTSVQEIIEQYNATFHDLFYEKDCVMFVYTFERHIAEENPSLVIQCMREIVEREQLQFTGIGYATGYSFRGSVGSDFRREYGLFGELIKRSISFCNYANDHLKGSIVCDGNTATILEEVCTIKPLGTCHLEGVRNQKLHSVLLDVPPTAEDFFFPKGYNEHKRASEGNVFLNLDSHHLSKLTHMLLQQKD
ncbi:predicted protein [Naegleria gruberi]|uniref:Predicted protein n=1 Tax=Naegleria gruberi TaxID=5762 RepID=D2VME2_NAEGR|nr:uncharacterized protein NAEGRDRAFT_70102 [Naegleria gruberi]EFC42046.1 predicted protein [Naegleria gruberi]|eukprot:XP_002674790.1 predicted protein [Naegleria gruberi strain NEG-M]